MLLEKFFIVFRYYYKNNFIFFLLGYGMIELSFVCYVILFDNIKYGFVGVFLLNFKCKVSIKLIEDNKLIF